MGVLSGRENKKGVSLNWRASGSFEAEPQGQGLQS